MGRYGLWIIAGLVGGYIERSAGEADGMYEAQGVAKFFER
jgi:hypothetical protein